jgi:phage FluMu gp28-like protein
MAPFLADLKAQLAAIDLKPQFAFGSDFARNVDLTTGSLMAIEQRLKRREVLAYELRNVPGDEQKLIAKTVLEAVRNRLVGAAFDATGMGWTVAEDMGRIFGLRVDDDSPGLVMAVKFSEEWYRIHMPPLKAAFEDDAIALIKDADHLGDLRAVKLVRGIARVPTQREGETGKKRHGDHAIAVALAHFASRMRFVEYGYQPVVRETTSAFGDQGSDDGAWWTSPLGAQLRGRL